MERGGCVLHRGDWGGQWFDVISFQGARSHGDMEAGPLSPSPGVWHRGLHSFLIDHLPPLLAPGQGTVKGRKAFFGGSNRVLTVLVPGPRPQGRWLPVILPTCACPHAGKGLLGGVRVVF